MPAGALPARPARPVADAPLAVLTDLDALAKGWLLTLIAQAPLARAGDLPAADLVRDAPRLCGAILGALASDSELDRLRPEGDLALLASGAGRLAGAGEPAAASAAIAALRASLWSAVVDALARPEPELVSALAARLGLVCDVIVAAALVPGPVLHVAPAPAGALASEPPRLTSVPRPAPEATPEPVSDNDNEQEHEAGERRSVPADVFPTVAVPPHDERTEPWATAVVRRLGRLIGDGRPCGVLAVDVDEAERLIAADLGGAARAAIDRAERAVRDELRPGDAAIRERDGRLWIIAQNTSLDGARSLGRRLAAAVASSASLHGAPLTASIGIAVCPDDGDDPAALVAHADEGVFAARAAGVSLA